MKNFFIILARNIFIAIHNLVLVNKLEVLNPLNTLNRGYAIVKKDNKVLSSIKNINEGENITISLKDGNIESKIIKVGEK